jgi:virulence-associated protein VapD
MDSTLRKGINFDLMKRALIDYYPKSNWRNAYEDVKKHFLANGFEHIQGSGYHSIVSISQVDAMDIVLDMIEKHPWINKCVGVCTIADIHETCDITNLFNKEADIKKREDVQLHRTMGEYKNAIKEKRDQKETTDFSAKATLSRQPDR